MRNGSLTELQKRCDVCQKVIYLYVPDDFQCCCGAWYNCYGQRLKDNPNDWCDE